MSTVAVAAPPPNPEIPALSEPARIVNTFVAPSKTFTDLRRSAAWWGPFLLLAIVSVAFIYIVDQKIGFRKVTENQIQMSPKRAQQLDQLNAEAREQQIQTQVRITKYISYGFWVLILVWYLLVALVLWVTFRFLAGASDLKFTRTFAVVMYSILPHVIRTLLAIANILAGASPEGFTMQNPIGTNPGYFMSPTDSPFLYSIASSLDVFMIWSLLLGAIGLSCVSKLKRSTAMYGIFGWYVVITLVGACFALLGR